MQIYCAKGCGYPVTISDEMLEEAKELNAPLNVAHEVCPPDMKVLPKYRVKLEVHRTDPDTDKEVLLTTVGGEVEAPTFSDAYLKLSARLTDQWAEVDKWKGTIEDDLPE